jgi:hypothetical protein
MKPKILESQIQKQILDYLELKHIFHYRQNTGAMKSEYKGKSYFMRFGAVGSSDIFCVIKGLHIGIEVKTPQGKQSESQKKYQKALEAAGGRYFIATCLEDVMKNI